MQANNLRLNDASLAVDGPITISTPTPSLSSVPAADLPKVLIIALDPVTQGISTDFLQGKARVTISRNEADAFYYLLNDLFSAVLIADPTLTQIPLPALRSRVTLYAKSGGRVILCYGFATLIRPSQFEYYMLTEFGLPWKYGNYYRTEFSLSSFGTNLCHELHFLPCYSMGAVSLKDVDPESRIYQPTTKCTSGETVNTDHIDSSTSIDTNQAPIVFTKIGKGWLGFIGDVNIEMGTVKILLAMIDSKFD